ncbi:MAG: transcriptional regulator [Frankiales bacterium]|nr:transcriptional regulator [Frankiales bacterium]
MAVSTPYEHSGRASQKGRTRAALVDAARSLVSEGKVPTVDTVAERAAISRTTAYRYFPSQRALLGAAHPETATSSLLGDDPPQDVAARLDLVMREFTRILMETESQQRTMLRLSLEDSPGDLPLRQGRAIGWITEALEPLGGTLPDDELRRLVLAVRSVCGIEPLVWLTDIGGLSAIEATELMRWSAASLLRSAVEGHRPTAGASAPGRSRAGRGAGRRGRRP